MWQRYNQTTHIFEKSTDNGVVWTPMMINQSSIEGTTPLPANIAYTNVSNIFTSSQNIDADAARLILSDTSQPVDQRKFYVGQFNQKLYLHAINDSGGVGYGYLTIDRSGSIVVSGSLSAVGITSTGNITISGATTFTITTNSGICDITLTDTYNASTFRILNYLNRFQIFDTAGSKLQLGHDSKLFVIGYIYPGRVDTPGSGQETFYIASHFTYGLYSNTGMYLVGSVVSEQSIRATTYVSAVAGYLERSRSAYMGEWIAHTPSIVAGGSITAVTTSKYCLIGKTCIYLYHFTVNIPSATTYLQWYIPVTANGYVTNPAMASTTPCIGYTWPGYNTMFTMRDTSQVQAFASGTYYLSGIIIIPFD